MNENEEKNIQTNNSQVEENSAVNAIANSEARQDEVRIEGAKQENADFTSMFGVASEETQEEKELKKQSVEIPRVLEVKDEDREEANKINLTDEEKKANHKKYFNSDERLVYNIEEEKQGNPIFVLFFFLVLITVVLILPQISKKVDFSSLFKTSDVTPGANGEEEEENKFIKLESAASRAKIGQLEMINFVKSHIGDEYKISFTIQNVGDRIYRFDKKYYFVLYNKEAPLYYAIIHSYNGVPSKAAQEISLVISKYAYEKANQFRIEEIVEEKYPEVQLTESEGDYKVLTCRYLGDEMRYYFSSNKLAKIKETYIETSENRNFSSDLEKFKNLTEKYKKINSFTSTFVQESDRFTQINEMQLKNITDNQIISLQTYRFFRYNTDVKTVSFEAESIGYTCS